MKKLLKSMLIILIAACLLVTVAGCGKKEEKTSIPEAKSEIANEPTDTEVEKDETKEFSMGEWNGNTYTNDFLGIKYNLPSGWSRSTDEEIAEMMNVSAELLGDEQKANIEIAKLTSVYYLAANDPSTGENVIVMSEKPLMDVTTEFYLNSLKTQLEALTSIEYTMGETSKAKIGAREYSTLSATANSSGVKLEQKYYIYKSNDMFVVIIATASNDNGINKIMQSFE